MKTLFLALAGFALAASMPARAAETIRAPGKTQTQKKAQAPGKTRAPAKKSSRTAGKAPARSEMQRSEEAARVAEWIAASKDNGALPYIIVDKKAAALLLFDAKGRPLGQVPVLIGVAVGDEATPGIGSKSLSEIGPAERTTPAGRFLAKFGLAAGTQKVLWVDYATSVALHPIPPATTSATKKERRRDRLLSPTIDDNRITFGCINVPKAFYSKSVSPLFQRKGGYVYVLPDTKPLETVFPRLRIQAVMNGGASS